MDRDLDLPPPVVPPIVPPEPTGGDAVCWLERVCPDCGALVEAELPAVCWRCGADVFPS